MAKNIFGKTRNLDKPYAEYQCGSITYRILKTYKMASNETSQFDRWFTAGKSPMSYDQWEYGDMYIAELMSMNPELTQATDEWRKTYE